MHTPPPEPETTEPPAAANAEPAEAWRPPTLEDVVRRARRMGLLAIPAPARRGET